MEKRNTHCRNHSKIPSEHRRKKGANSIPFNTQNHGNSSEDKTITLQYCITLHYERWLYDQKVKRSNTTKEFSIDFYVKLNKIELSYRIHLKFNLSDTHISWKRYLIGSSDVAQGVAFLTNFRIICNHNKHIQYPCL